MRFGWRAQLTVLLGLGCLVAACFLLGRIVGVVALIVVGVVLVLSAIAGAAVGADASP